MQSFIDSRERERSAMMKWVTIIPCFVILVIAGDVSANQCNLYNFGMQGGFGCAMQWFQQEDLGQTIPVTYKISDMVQSVLIRFNISSAVMVSALPPPFQTGSPDPVAKIIESMATLEPFLAFLVADVIEAADFTSDQLQQLGIPGELSTRANRVTMIREYFDFSCSDKGMKSLVSCLRNWMNENCQGQADNQFTNAWLDRLQSAYCDGTTANPQVISELVGKLGTIKDALPFFGLEKDPSSPYGMKILTDAPIYMSNLTSRLTQNLIKTCSYVTAPSVEEIFSVSSPNSTLSAGNAVKTIMRFTEIVGKCYLGTIKDTFSQYQQALEKLIDAGTFITAKRDGLNFDKKEADVDGERSSTVAYGDPHVDSSDRMEHETCSAEGWQMYLANTFFTVEGFSSLAANGADGTFITQIQIKFSDRKGGMLAQYMAAFNETLPFSYEDPSGNELITVESDGDMVKISDQNSKAVFMINKYKGSYNIVVRMADSLYDQSFGLLVTGCLSPSPPFTERASDECQQTCSIVPDVYQSTCLFDCQTTGDVGVGSISTLTENLKEAAENSDQMMVKQKTTKSPESSTPDSSAAFVTMETSLIATSLILSVMY